MKKRAETLPGNGFTFKQFFVAHDRCAMKVNTDSIILGAWADVGRAKRLLDAGAGSGILALMLAQRTAVDAIIDAVELDESAFLQAKENYLHSPWRDKIRAVHEDFIDFSRIQSERYDVIISNPPYFEPGVVCHSRARNLARYTASLTHEALLSACRTLLTERGRLYLVLPYSAAARFLQIAMAEGWHCGKKMAVHDTLLKPPHLLLLEIAPYCLSESECRLAIRDADRRYSDAFCELTKDFYLFF